MLDRLLTRRLVRYVVGEHGLVLVRAAADAWLVRCRSLGVPVTIDSARHSEFDYLEPFGVDADRAEVIAGWLSRKGHPACTADVVAAELARPDSERTIIGRFASAWLYQTR